MKDFLKQEYCNCTHSIVVPVIASFDTEGRIKPLYVRLCGTSYKIDSSREGATMVNTTDFHCKMIDGESYKPLLLTFHRRENMWTTRVSD